jgi:hypothetical protein
MANEAASGMMTESVGGCFDRGIDEAWRPLYALMIRDTCQM